METSIAIFRGKGIRKTIHNNEWWFVVEDVVLALIDSKDPKQYIQKMKQRDPELSKGWVQIVHTLSIETAGGMQKMLCANTEGLFRIIQSGFRHRRKTLINALRLDPQFDPLDMEEIVLGIGCERRVRAEVLRLEDFARLSNVLFDRLANAPCPRAQGPSTCHS